MLSIIICSAKPDLLCQVSENIAKTVGIPYEIVAVDNRFEPKGICEVYNRAAAKSKYDYLCFVHEDVKFATPNWGGKLMEALRRPEIGLVGIAGAAHKPKIMSGWGAEGLRERFVKINLVQHFKRDQRDPIHQYFNSEGESLAQVVVVDGVFLAARKSVILEIPFDEQVLRGFHGYDIDISLAIGEKYQVAVILDIRLEHFSEGSLDADWVANSWKVHKKWAHKLPKSVMPITKRERINCEKRTYRHIIRILKENGAYGLAWKVLHRGELMQLNKLTYLKMYYSYAKGYLGLFRRT
ncbi:hypothetical protein ADIS_0325 [Lunatimonas lonarensis]|uniref:Streptomycin biosynthesis protein StrF domain-containing protein n=1 Tax=Lunatimonas lonarensis TaxID=1232681 RepID=R7ZYN5_9BACT|nr:glycosyltransferase [Lunatimonas lonarensis]EON79216.1 hypothetical protein ADIS_0325 [Lunatimonas lonarensis]